MPLADALRRRDPAPILARADRQLRAARAAGATPVALDLNLGAGRGVPDARLAGDLAWAAAAIRGRRRGAALWLDCGSHGALAAAAARVPPPAALNALSPGRPGGRALAVAAASAGAELVVSPALAADPQRAAAEARAPLVAAGVAWAWFDCLMIPAPVPFARTLALVRALAADRSAPRLRPLVAVGNAAHARGPGGERPAPAVRAALVALCAAAACGAGAEALIAPLERPSLLAAVAVASGARPPRGPAGAWLREAARAAAAGEPIPPPDAALAASRGGGSPDWASARGLLCGRERGAPGG